MLLAFDVRTHAHPTLRRSLRWRRVYGMLIVVYPLCAMSLHIGLAVNYHESVGTVGGMKCDDRHPRWYVPEPVPSLLKPDRSGLRRVRLVGYTGPLLLMVPILYLTIVSIVHVRATNQHLERSKPKGEDVAVGLDLEKRPSVPTSMMSEDSEGGASGVPTFVDPNSAGSDNATTIAEPRTMSVEVDYNVETDEFVVARRRGVETFGLKAKKDGPPRLSPLVARVIVFQG